MLKTELYSLINYARQDNNLPPMSKEDYIKALSSLEASGYVASYGENVEVIKEYKGGMFYGNANG